MTPFDQRRVDPASEELVRLLVAAAKAANGWRLLRRLGTDPRPWARFLDSQRDSPEGHRSFRGGSGGLPAPLVEASWWTDPAGRRHWRVVGRRAEAEPPGWRWGHHDVLRTFPLWHVYPQHLGFRQVLGVEPIAVCTCGAGGVPEAIGWMGQRCGPCHDRLEEGLPPFPAAALSVGSLSQVAFTDEGRLLTGGQDGQVSLWGLSDGSCRTLLRLDEPISCLEVSPRGQLAVSAEPGEVILSGLDGERRRSYRVESGVIYRLRFSPSGGLLVVLGDRDSFLLDLNARDVAPPPLPGRRFHDWTFLPEGLACVIQEYGRGVARLDLRTWEETLIRTSESPADSWVYADDAIEFLPLDIYPPGQMQSASPDGRWFALDGGWAVSPVLHLADLGTGEWWPLRLGELRPATQAIRFTRDGKLAVVQCGAVQLWNPATQKLEGVVCLPQGEHGWGRWALSPGGELLAAADYCGNVQVWPWRRLLGDPA